jgi:hypothetical protein
MILVVKTSPPPCSSSIRVSLETVKIVKALPAEFEPPLAPTA